jgi:cobalt/nickel transport system permease protein
VNGGGDVTHLHIPDGVLPWWLWVGGAAVAAVLLAAVSRRHRHDRRDRLALLGAFCALMLAAMSLPLGPLGYHLSLAPLLGILLGGGLAFVGAFVANVILALFGHGGITVVGLNTLITGASAALAGAAYRGLARRGGPFRAAALATVAGLGAALVLWLAVVAVAGLTPNPGHAAHAHLASGAAGAGGAAAARTRLVRFAALSAPVWLIGIVAEALVCGGVVSFLAKVSPGLLGGPAGRRES